VFREARNDDADDSSEDSRAEALDRVLLLFTDAEQVLDVASDDAPEIAYERAETQDQLARIHLEADLPESALPYSEKSAAGFRALLPERAYDYDIAEQMTAWLLNRFHGRDAAVARLEEAVAVCVAAGVEAPRCTDYLATLQE
jgi:hypothetical protein